MHFKSLCLAIVLLLGACVPSLHPFYTAETIVTRDEIVGVWKEKPDAEEVWTFTKAEDKMYKLVYEEKEGRSPMDVHIVKLGDAFFLDLYPSDDGLKEAKVGDFYKSCLIRGHLIVKARIGPALTLQFLDPDELKKQLTAAPESLQHTLINKEELVITAPTADLQKFFKKHAETRDLWGEPTKMEKQLL